MNRCSATVAFVSAVVQECSAAGATRLAEFKVPREIDFVTELPHNETGKVVKRGLDEQQRS